MQPIRWCAVRALAAAGLAACLLGAAGATLDDAERLNDEGVAAAEAGDLTRAETIFHQALVIYERTAPDSQAMARCLTNLAGVTATRGDLDAAMAYMRRAWAIQERLAPDDAEAASMLNNLGVIASDRGDVAAALDYAQRSLAIRERLAPDSVEVATSLHNLGALAHSRGDLELAQDCFERAFGIYDRAAPVSVLAAHSLGGLAAVAHDRREFATAVGYQQRNLAIQERFKPDSLEVARTLGNLADFAIHLDDSITAVDYASRAVAVFERLRGTITSAEGRALFAEYGSNPYSILIIAHLFNEDPFSAFAAVERSRSRGLIEGMVERAADLSDAPAELVVRQAAVLDRRAAAYTTLGRVDTDSPEAEAARADVARLAIEQRELEAAIHLASPRYATLTYPGALDLAASRAALPPGTVSLNYVVARGFTVLFVISRERFGVYPIRVVDEELRAMVANLVQPRSLQAPATEDARRMYDLLVRPAQDAIETAERVLICPDDALNLLPFGALVSGEVNGQPRYFIEDVPLHETASLSLFAELQRQAGDDPAAPDLRLLAIGDPTYLTVPTAPAAQLMAQRGAPLAALPHTRDEVESLARLYGDGSRVLMGDQATEATVRAAASEAGVLHFACHGLLDGDDPFGSCLALTPTADDDGLLRAFEILETMRLTADLVVLSACRTGLGELRRYDGVLGLTRAFQYAGAESVVVSLWGVPDESTKSLMVAFHEALLAGQPRDQALRSAQRALIEAGRGGATIGGVPLSSPYCWAAFKLVGLTD